MSNISYIESSFSFPFLQGYVIDNVRMKNLDPRNGEAIMGLSGKNGRYEMNVELHNGKKEGVGLIMRENGTLFMKVMFLNDECEGEVIKKNEEGKIVMRGKLDGGKEVGLFTEYDDSGREIWRGFYRYGMRLSTVLKSEKKGEFHEGMNDGGELLRVSESDNDMILLKGKCYELKEGKVDREYEYKNGELIRVLREWKREVMIEYDDNGRRVYEGEYEGDMKRGFFREREGTEYDSDGKRPLYFGDWKNGVREGYGSEFRGYYAVYIGEWKNGMRYGIGKEYNDNEEVLRSERWMKGEYGETKQFEDGYGNDLKVFDTSCLKGVNRLVIGDRCFMNVKEFVLDGLNELESVKIGHNSFYLDWDTRKGSKCLIMNCDRLRELEIGEGSWQSQGIWERSVYSCSSFKNYEVFELKNLPSLISFRCSQYIFYRCHSVVLESENENQ